RPAPGALDPRAEVASLGAHPVGDRRRPRLAPARGGDERAAEVDPAVRVGGGGARAGVAAAGGRGRAAGGGGPVPHVTPPSPIKRRGRSCAPIRVTYSQNPFRPDGE